jgi:hypothetical protein
VAKVGYSSGSSFGVKVEGLEQASRIPGWLDVAQREWVDDFARTLARNIGRKVHSESGRLAASWQGRAISATAGIIESRTTAYVKAQDRGAYITARKGEAIRFPGTNEYAGRTIFVRKTRTAKVKGGVRLAAQRFVRRGLRDRRKIVLETFALHFGNLKRQTGAISSRGHW